MKYLVILIAMIVFMSSSPSYAEMTEKQKADFKQTAAITKYDKYFKNTLNIFGDVHPSWTLIKAIAIVESRLDPTRVSSRGAKGLLQIMRPTFKHTVNERGLPYNITHFNTGCVKGLTITAIHSLHINWVQLINYPKISYEDKLDLLVLSHILGVGRIIRSINAGNVTYKNIVNNMPDIKPTALKTGVTYVRHVRYARKLTWEPRKLELVLNN